MVSEAHANRIASIDAAPSDPSDPASATTTNTRLLISDGAARVCAVMLVLYALYYARSLVVPVVTALAFYLVLRPVVRRARRFGIPSAITAALILVGLLLSLAIGTYLVIDPAREIAADAPRHVDEMKEKLSFLLEKVQYFNEATEQLADSAEETDSQVTGDTAVQPIPVEIKQPAWTSNASYLSGTGNAVSFITIAAALLYFLLASGDELIINVMRAMPTFTSRKRLIETIEDVQEGLGSYLAKISAINACLGIAVGIAMTLLGMPSPVLWGVMAFAFNFIPMIGAIVGAMIIFVVALVNFEPTFYAFICAGTFVTLTTLEGQFLTPAILGRSMSISPVLVFLSIVVWGWMWGVMGIFLSVPILIAIRMACENYEGLQSWAIVLGAPPPTPKPTQTQTDVVQATA